MPSVVYSRTVQGAGIILGARPLVRTADHPNPYEVTLPVALAVTGWTKTDADTAVCNEPDDWTAGNYDVYWSGGMRYGVAATAIGTTGTIELDGGSGDDFPASATEGVVICKQVQIDAYIVGDNIHILAIELAYPDTDSTSKGHLDLQAAGTAGTIHEVDLDANDMQVWDVDGGDTNDFASSTVVVAYASHDDTTYEPTLRILSLEDSTP